MTATLHCEIIGEGPPLILLHGWGWHSGIWKPVIPTLSQSFQLFLIDLPGCGKSTVHLTDYTFEKITNFLFPLVPEKATWLGWSLGGMLAWWVALHHPEKINQLVTVATSPRFVSDTNWPGVSIPTLEKFSTSLINNTEQTLIEFLELQLRGSLHSVELFHALKNQLITENKPQLSALLGGLQLLRETDLRNEKLSCKSLHIFGSLDTLVAAQVATLIPPYSPYGQCEIIKRSGHMPFLSPEFLILLNHLRN